MPFTVLCEITTAVTPEPPGVAEAGLAMRDAPAITPAVNPQ
ncbi:hypothetical protein [Nonomuraea sp. NPDC003709]